LAPASPGDLCFLRDHREQKLYWVDLTTNIFLSGLLSGDVINSIDAPPGSPWQDSGAFFYDDMALYLFAGLPNTGTPVDTIWSYNTSTEKWKELAVAGGKLNFGTRRNAWFASELMRKRSFYLGGSAISIQTIARFVKGLLVIDARDPSHLTWENKTVSGGDGEEVPSTFEGAMVYVPKGKEGVLLGMGGYDVRRRRPASRNAKPGEAIYRHMDQIYVYDIESSTWYTVTATGDIPSDEAQFCAAVFSSPDGSSFQVYIYGGFCLLTSTTNEEVYILTIPSFRWIKVATIGNLEAELSSGAGKSLAHCLAWRERTMFAVGGYIGLDTGHLGVNAQGCNQSYPPIRVLDTSELAWLTHYDFSSARQPYFVPKAVYNVIGGDPSGNAQLNSPEDGWKNQRLSTIFAQTAQSLMPTATTSNAHPTETGTPPPKYTGKIAGGVIGGVLGVVLIVGIVVWLRHRRR
ncbi:hypothetical protein K440DRAFT_490519, partial [Wilcoxina mikolae CBS 423.85]